MVSAQNYITALENIGKSFFWILTAFDALLFSVFTLLFFLLFALYLAIIHKVPPFGSEGKSNRYGKIVAGCLAFGSCLSIFFLTREGGLRETVYSLLQSFGIFGAAILAILFFMLIFFGFGVKEEGRWQLALIGIGLSLAIVSYYISFPGLSAVGWLVGAGAIVLYISSTGIWKDTLKSVKDGTKDEKKK